MPVTACGVSERCAWGRGCSCERRLCWDASVPTTRTRSVRASTHLSTRIPVSVSAFLSSSPSQVPVSGEVCEADKQEQQDSAVQRWGVCGNDSVSQFYDDLSVSISGTSYVTRACTGTPGLVSRRSLFKIKTFSKTFRCLILIVLTVFQLCYLIFQRCFYDHSDTSIFKVPLWFLVLIDNADYCKVLVFCITNESNLYRSVNEMRNKKKRKGKFRPEILLLKIALRATFQMEFRWRVFGSCHQKAWRKGLECILIGPSRDQTLKSHE